MKVATAFALLAPAVATAKSLASLLGVSDVTKEMYRSGRVHEAIMEYKMVSLLLNLQTLTAPQALSLGG